MYYIPVLYYGFTDTDIYESVTSELKNNLIRYKKNYYEKKVVNTKNNMIEKTVEYVEYKSCLIRLILIDYAYANPNKLGKDLLDSLINKWINQKTTHTKIIDQIYDRAIANVIKYENTINNIEEILMLISLQILEYFYFN
jgi:hypothetical protein